MKSTTLAAAIVLAALAGTAQAQDLSYVPGVYQYQLATEMHTKQEMMGQTQEMHRAASQFITLKLDRKSADALGFSITVDSTRTDSSSGPVPASEGKLVGKTVTGTVSPRGRILTFSAPVDSAVTEAEFRGLRTFFVRLPDKNGRGAMIVDTLADTIKTNGMEIKQSVVMTSTVLGDTTIDGQRAIILERRGNLTMSGEGQQGGQELVLDGTGTVQGHIFVGASGGVLGGRMMNEAQMNVAVPGAGLTIPVVQSSTSTIARLPSK